MGNFFKKIPSQKFDESLVMFLKTRKMSHINEAIEIINDSYPTSSTLVLDEYLDVFAPVLEDKTEDVFLLLENKRNIDGKVDIYESLASIIVFCGEEFPVKLQYIFSMFDFDKSGAIELKELVLTFQTCIRALCKFVYIEPPSLAELEYFANKLFSQVDTDRSRSISFAEFSEWMSESWELQDFLLQYALIQTHQNAKRRTTEKTLLYNSIFEKTSGGGNVQECDSESLFLMLRKTMEYLDENIKLTLFKMLEDSSKETAQSQGKELAAGIILKEAYCDIMQAWASFDATDINNDNQVSIQELKFLLYAYEGDVPDDFRVYEEMQHLDKDKSGYINRQEWVNYLCLDPENQGKTVFRGNLKRLFNKFDSDNSGSLSMIEIKNLLKDNLKEHSVKFKHRSKQEQADYDGMIDTLAEQIVNDLNADADKSISWIEFKNFMDKAYSKQETLRDFLKQF